MPEFSIIVVCLNAGKKLAETIESILNQTFLDYEIIVKDGGSTDGSVETLQKCCSKKNLFVFQQEDSGIYDAMNQAVSKVHGKYLLFLNCGDCFYDSAALQKIYEAGREVKETPVILYGNIFEKLTGSTVASNPSIDAFGCYRNVPCHQACFYERSLFGERGYDTSYRVRADYEHFLWCYFVKEAYPIYVPITVASYEGGGFSETKENQRKSAKEHKEAVRKYMSSIQILKYRMILLLTLAPVRKWIAQTPKLAGFYNGLKKRIYKC